MHMLANWEFAKLSSNDFSNGWPNRFQSSHDNMLYAHSKSMFASMNTVLVPKINAICALVGGSKFWVFGLVCETIPALRFGQILEKCSLLHSSQKNWSDGSFALTV